MSKLFKRSGKPSKKFIMYKDDIICINNIISINFSRPEENISDYYFVNLTLTSDSNDYSLHYHNIQINGGLDELAYVQKMFSELLPNMEIIPDFIPEKEEIKDYSQYDEDINLEVDF